MVGLRLKLMLAASCLTPPLLIAAPAVAQSEVEEVIVTASRREEALSKVPVSVAAYTREAMDERGVRNIDDAARMTPGVTFNRTANTSSGISNISIRGISSDAGSATTGIYIDDTPVQTRSVVGGDLLSSTYPAVFDLDRVEILRGPQGTLFGAGSEGGTVRFITAQPKFGAASLYGRAGMAFTRKGDPSFEAGLAGGGVLVEDRVAVRASGWYRRDGGYVDRVDHLTGNMVDKASNWQDSYVGRIAVALRVTDALTVTPSVYHQDIRYNDNNSYWEDLSDPKKTRLRKGNPLSVTSRDRFWLPAIKAEWDLGFADLTLNSSYFDRKIEGVGDLTTFEIGLWTGNPYFPAGTYVPFYNGTAQTNLTHEVRLQSKDPDARLTWLVGAFYQKAEQSHFEHVEDTFLPDIYHRETGGDFNVDFPGGLYLGKYTVYMDPLDTVDEQIALFGQADFKVTDKLKLTAGLRYAKTDFSIHGVYQGPIIGERAEDRGSQSAKPLTPKFSVSYQASDEAMVYATAAKGFRSGGYNAPIASYCGVSKTGAPIPGTDLGDLGLANRPALFADDSVWSYELGGKGRFAGGRIQVDASVYQVNWDNIQTRYDLGRCGFSFITNAGSATSKGVDLQLQARATDGLTLGAAVGYNDATFDQTIKGPHSLKAVVSKGDQVSGVPYTVTLFGRYGFTLMDREAYVRLDLDHRAKQSSRLVRLNPANGAYDANLSRQPAITQVSARAGVSLGDLDVLLYADNLLNAHPSLARSHAYSSSPLYTDMTLRPLTVGVTLTYRR